MLLMTHALNKSGQDKSGQDKSGQDKSGQDKSGQVVKSFLGTCIRAVALKLTIYQPFQIRLV
jgi:hypothetical protein